MLPCRGLLCLPSLSASRSSSGAPALAEGRASSRSCFWLRASAVSVSLSLSHSRVLCLSPAVSVFTWPCSLSPSLLVWLGVEPTIHLWITLHFGRQVPCLWWGWGSSVSPLYPSIPVSVLSHPWLALPHLSLSCLRLPESPVSL